MKISLYIIVLIEPHAAFTCYALRGKEAPLETFSIKDGNAKKTLIWKCIYILVGISRITRFDDHLLRRRKLTST